MAVYVLSDVHGLKDRFDAMIKKIELQKDDILYVLGDVIDRGEHGIALLQEIRKAPNMILLMGNHEHMMMEYYDATESLKHGSDVLWAMERIHRWDMNHNQATKRDFEALSIEEQKDLLGYLHRLPLAFPDVEVQGRHYYLVHANWHPKFQTEPVYLEECAMDEVDPIHLLWDRIDANHPLPEGKTLIFGHTVTLFLQAAHPYQVWTNQVPIQDARLIDIDCGCAANNEDTRLACIRLDDREVFYV